MVSTPGRALSSPSAITVASRGPVWTRLVRARLVGARLVGARLVGARLVGARLRPARVPVRVQRDEADTRSGREEGRGGAVGVPQHGLRRRTDQLPSAG
ncbi:pentapeptide repeat-containing protein [Streptomyces sp. PU-14G]|uniref:pentapeptide repeat-containing protein n=1 Tax=Streptomyces sp. PU-14G TaxID=2800808 RepID=UPI0034E04A8F